MVRVGVGIRSLLGLLLMTQSKCSSRSKKKGKETNKGGKREAKKGKGEEAGGERKKKGRGSAHTNQFGVVSKHVITSICCLYMYRGSGLYKCTQSVQVFLD